ncbi:MAG TPA: chemotaxis protein CheB [Verrucomicrobiae bacterium]|jgi:two-component system, chemotaxis family, CheB/CheR fusion protein|nr:chemotaxis protein CheB [Verrucomicrobiae bacterium]
MKRDAPRRKSASRRPPPRRAPAATPTARVEHLRAPSGSRGFPIVGIGASAGGLEAFSQLLRALPTDTGMAFVLVQHLDPQHESQLSEILARTTAMPVVTITDGLEAEPNQVYVIPSNTDMTIAGGRFALTPREAVDRHMPIDHFFRSLAHEPGARAIGVVLSGTGSDGTLGLRSIKTEGGIAFVQDEKSARHPGMPQSAAAFADLVLPPAEIAGELARIGNHSYVSPTSPGAARPEASEDGADISGVLRVLRSSTGVDFAQYKAASVRRRIARRMLLQRVNDLPEYVRYVRQNPDEARALHDDILIQVTGFFRDPEGFEALKQSVFPNLVTERPREEPIRIWVAGCATGEEAYSLVISLMEFLGQQDSNPPIQLFATDLSAAAVARARAGTFPASIENEVSPDRLRRFFVKSDGRYQISKAIRDACVFARHDATRDPPFSKLDLISCCNLLIYLGAGLQERIIPIFHYALKPTGFLKLGPSEGVGRFTNLFSTMDKKHKIFARKSGPSAHLGFGLTAGARNAAPSVQEDKGVVWSTAAVEKEADRLVLGRYAPAGVIVNADMEIVQFRGKTGPYLEAAPGAASLQLFRMAREGLTVPLRRAVQRAIKSGDAVKTDGLWLRVNGGAREVAIEVIPIGLKEGIKGQHHLILFFDERYRPGGPLPAKPTAVPARRGKTRGDRRLTQLTQELAAARQQLQATSEEQEAALEELRAATEEAQSSSEELQSTNEELETSKEELQAANEELTTVNDELNSRNLEVGQLASDLGNLLASTHVPIILVGADLRVRRMTSVSERILDLAPGDVGRPIGDLRLGAEIPDLEGLLRDVIETLTPQEREVTARDGRWYSVRVRPYRTVDNKIDGAVVSFVDINALKESVDAARAIVETVREPLVVLDDGLEVVTANRAFFETFRVRADETERRSLFELGDGQWNIPQLRTALGAVLVDGRILNDFEVQHDFERIGPRTMLLNARRMPMAVDRPALVLLAIADISERARIEHERADLLTREQGVRVEAEAASLAKDKFLAILSHELRTPLNAMLGWARILRNAKRGSVDVAHGLEVIERNALLQVRLIEDLLDVSRIVSGVMRLEMRPLMLVPVVQTTLGTMQPAAAAKGVTLHGAVDEQVGAVLGDPARLQQIVWNLVSNAIKFTPSGGRVDVRVARRDAVVEVSVSDTGRGIAADRLAEVFNPFEMAHTTTQSHGGMGLGLSIARHLVLLHGGSVKAESQGLGLGATFTVTLPLTDARPPQDAATPRIAALAPGAPPLPALHGVRIVAVDDEADARELIRAILVQCGAEVTAVAGVRAALEALDRASFDVLVSDIVMPEEDGYTLIRQVRARGADRGGDIPALALTAYSRIEDRAAAVAAGYQQHLAKPIEPAELAAAIAALAARAEGPRGA